MALGVGLAWTLLAKDDASPAFLRVAAAADKAAASTARATSTMSKSSAAIGAAGAKLTKGLTVPLLGIAAVSVKAATDFQSSMTRIETQAGAPAKAVQYLSKQVLAMKGAQQGPNDLANALYHLKSVGMDNVDAMKALKTASDLAAVGGADLESTTNALAGAWRTGIKGAQDFHEAAATVNAVIGAGNMRLQDLNDALSTGILPSAKTFGLTFKDVGSALALFTDESVPANVAATRLRMSFSLLAAPSGAAEEQLKKIGLTGFQLGQDMRKPDGLITAIGDLKTHLDDAGLHGTAAAQLLSHAFGGGRSSSAILSMINNFNVLKQKQDQVTNSIGKYDSAVKQQGETAAASFHRSLAQFEQAGVELGTQLLPIATDVAKAVMGIASGFNSLSDGQKKFIVEAGVALALLGPMLALVGRLGKAIAFMWAAGIGASRFIAGVRGAELSIGAMESRAYGAGLKLRAMGTAATGAAAAVAGIGIGLSIGMVTRDSSQATKAVGALGSIALGAAAGFAVGGPFGAAVGAATGLLSDMAGAIHSTSTEAAEMATNVNDLSGAIQKDGLVIGAMTRQMAAQKLVSSGVLANSDALGLSYRTLLGAALGHKDALAQVNKVYQANVTHISSANAATVFYARSLLHLGQATKDSLEGQRRLSAETHVFGNDARTAAHAASRNADSLGNLSAGSHDAAAATQHVITAMHGATGSAQEFNKYIVGLTKSFLGLVDAELGMAQSQDQVAEAIRSVTEQLKGTHDQFDLTSKAGLANRDSFLSAASAALSFQKAQRDAGVGVQQANRTLLANVEALRSAALAAGANKAQVDKLLGSLHLLPHDINTHLHLDTGPARSELVAIMNQINSLHPTIHVGVTGGHTLGVATGGPVYGPGSGTSDSIPARLSNGEYVIRASQARKHRMLLDSINRGARGFASGGSTDSPSSYRLVGPGLHGETFTTLGAAQRALAHAVASLSRLLTRLGGRDLTKFSAALSKTGSDVKSAFSSWIADAKSAGLLSRSQRNDLSAEAAGVAHLVNVRNRDQTRLQTLIHNRAAEKHTVAGAVRSSFDITSAGANQNGAVSFGAIRAQQLQQANIVKKWAAGIRKLGREGFTKSPTGLAMLRQLAEGGPGDWPQVQALLSASPKQLAGVISTQRQIDRAGASLGGYVGSQLYTSDIKHERNVVHNDMQRLSRAVERLEHRMEKYADRPVEVDVTLDGRKVASGTAKGTKQNARRK